MQRIEKHFTIITCSAILIFLVAQTFAENTPDFESTHSSSAAPATINDILSVDAVLHRALSFSLEEDYASAIPLLEQVIERDPTLLDAWEALGWAYWYEGQPERTEQLWRQLQLIDPDEPRIYNMMASFHLRNNNLTQSIQSYERSLGIDAEQPDIKFNLARVYRWGGHLSKAIRLLQPMVSEQPNRSDMRLELALALNSNWDYASALTHWQILRAEEPNNTDYLVAEALALLHTGKKETAVAQAHTALEKSPGHIQALHILADAGEFSANPQSGAPWLYELLNASEDEGYRQHLLARIASLYERLYLKERASEYLGKAIEFNEKRIAADSRNVDARLKRAELLLLGQEYQKALNNFQRVLDEFNPNNLRALRGIFEIHKSMGRWNNAEAVLFAISNFNPKDPYLLYDTALLAAQRGNFPAAYAALDQLELAGRRGAVAVLLYHSLGTTDYGQAPSKREFREQLEALRDAGYEFLTPDEVQLLFEKVDPYAEVETSGPPPRLAMVTFDDALVTAMEHGTSIAQDLDIVIAQHIIVKNTHRGDAYLSTWNELREYQDSGAWIFGSHSFYAHQEMPLTDNLMDSSQEVSTYDELARVVPVDEVARRAYPLGNRIWLKEKGRLENKEEFVHRLHTEYGRSQRDIQQELGTLARFFAYPFGEIGQQAASNEPEAIQLNIQVAGEYYDMAFLQSYFGHAVYGDHPLMYQRHEMPLRATGEETVRYFLDRHPVYLAQRTRLQFAMQERNQRRIQEARRALQSSNYPYLEEEIIEVSTEDRQRISLLGRPWRIEQEGKPFTWHLTEPYVRLELESFQDNLDSRYHRLYVTAGTKLAPNVLVEVHAGSGQYQQKEVFDESEPDAPRNIKIDELFAGAMAAVRYPSDITFQGEAGGRVLSGDATDSIPRVDLQLQGYWPMGGEWLMAYSHDAIPAAVAMEEGITYNRLSAAHVQPFGDFFLLAMNGRYYDISDGNARYHLDITPSWQFSEFNPLRLGLRYSYASSDQVSQVYWTPYQEQTFYAEAAIRQWLPMGLYYSLDARVGIGKEEARTGGEALSSSNDTDWETVFGLSASLSYSFTRNWTIMGFISYFESVEYDQTDIRCFLEYRF